MSNKKILFLLINLRNLSLFKVKLVIMEFSKLFQVIVPERFPAVEKRCKRVPYYMYIQQNPNNGKNFTDGYYVIILFPLFGIFVNTFEATFSNSLSLMSTKLQLTIFVRLEGLKKANFDFNSLMTCYLKQEKIKMPLKVTEQKYGSI